MSGMAGIHDGFDGEREEGGGGAGGGGGAKDGSPGAGQATIQSSTSKRLHGIAFLVARCRIVEGVFVSFGRRSLTSEEVEVSEVRAAKDSTRPSLRLSHHPHCSPHSPRFHSDRENVAIEKLDCPSMISLRGI